ncbi:MAG TPA: RNA polymerase sigma factor RpoD/SigA [Acidobacteriota bacterium]|nr:RNA polymerase sigma factor RpoD/SigA [Acidobacteriota bacterium]HNT18292.1 RNA polymerase sigma factor RpoD/SigA [Acidobacteriota bacterium]HPA27689.1 RNA polymerase sigma factor RpoD/SigA [Acidobacteriota bacterium]HQO20077.1 RNA polymerase sigma factor RpoD/SigA [Acidobacteriota bacterium]HQQ47338.1 RNA polymerase sigma factor RpoD/SigA [Acidobacteriota bacterium]
MAGDNRGQADPESAILKQYLKEISKKPLLTLEEELELGRRYRENGDAEALTELISRNLRYVVHTAKRFQNRGLSLLDLIHEGNLGLIEAARRFDPGKNIKLVHYADWWITQSMERALSDQGGPLRLPQKKATLFNNVQKARSELTRSLNREPSSAEIAEMLGIKESDVCEVVQAKNEMLSLDEPLLADNDVDILLKDKIADNNRKTGDEILIEKARKEILNACLAELSEKERKVLLLRYGFVDDEDLSLKEVGKIIGLSRERVRQIEEEALRKLKRSQKVNDLLRRLN